MAFLGGLGSGLFIIWCASSVFRVFRFLLFCVFRRFFSVRLGFCLFVSRPMLVVFVFMWLCGFLCAMSFFWVLFWFSVLLAFVSFAFLLCFWTCSCGV